MMSAYLALLLALLHALAGLGILIISTWFIAASAIAPLGFNYVIPAVVIRGLALLRIASGYATKWLGHDDLLTRTATQRLRLFDSLKNKRIEQKAWLTEALARHAQTVASAWIAWITPMCSAIVLNIVAIAVVTSLAMPGIGYLCVLAATWLLLTVWLCVRGVKSAIKQAHQELSFRSVTDDFFRTSPIWHLMPAFNDKQSADRLPSASALWQTSQQRDQRMQIGVWLFQGVALALVIGVIASQASMPMQTPIAIVVPMLLLAAPDWLGSSLFATRAYADDRVSHQALKSINSQPQPLLGRYRPSSYLALKSFKASGRNVTAIDTQLPATGVVLVKGSSGSGKSSLLRAIAGQLPSEGAREVDGVCLLDGLVEDWLYIEQDPVVLAGPVKHNLDPANAGIKEEAMLSVLRQLDLEALLPLASWVGTGGRPLSGGESKRLALARALLAEPDVLLIDEPFEGLDDTNQQRVASALNILAESRLVIVASHLEPIGLRPSHCVQIDTLTDGSSATKNHSASY